MSSTLNILRFIKNVRKICWARPEAYVLQDLGSLVRKTFVRSSTVQLWARPILAGFCANRKEEDLVL